LSARRWKHGQDPAQHTIRDMLAEALRQLDAGELHADHAILAFSVEDGRGCRTGWLQAGTLSPLGQLGLLTRISQEMVVSDKQDPHHAD
jgi:hypothetical protein